MDKIITINLGGYAIKIEEDAYEVLKAYIRQLEQTFSSTENGKEIISDIEARLAEMLLERTKGKISATAEDVEQVKKAMGNPGEFEGSSDFDANREEGSATETVRKRLYRDIDNQLVGGVCSGLANYFKVDPTVIRLIYVFLLLAMGMGFLLYIVLWIIVPAAATTAQKLEMKGEAPTLDNIINRVKTEAEKVEKNFKSQNFGNRIRNFFQSLTPLFKSILKSITLLMALFFLGLLVLLLYVLIPGSNSFIFHNDAIISTSIPNFFDSNRLYLEVKILVGMFFGIPLVVGLTKFLKFSFNSKVDYRLAHKVLFWVWLATIPLLIYFISLATKNFRYLEKVTSDKTLEVAYPIIIRSNFSKNLKYSDTKVVRIMASEDSLTHISILQKASGSSKKNASEMALKNGADYELKGGELILKTSDFFENSGLFRSQSVRFIIKVPEGKYFTIDPSLSENGVLVEGGNTQYYSHDEQKSSSQLLFLKGNLYCPTCPDSIPYGQERETYQNFNFIEAAGTIDLEIHSGNRFSVQKIGASSGIRHLNIWKSGRTLYLETDEEFFINRARPKVLITMPELVGLNLAGVVECNAGPFAGDELDLNISGASKLNMEAEFGKIDTELSGVSRLELSGRSEILSVSASGVTRINSTKLSSEKILVDVSGASDMQFGPSSVIEGDVSGASKLYYFGTPNLNVNRSGVSKVKQHTP